uniref:Orf115 n=1 Tax=Serratia marcescens TaxID=615 RepID=A0A7S6YKQ6_SERMA|nr:Orf115 [Serratia marcescens]
MWTINRQRHFFSDYYFRNIVTRGYIIFPHELRLMKTSLN